MKRERVIRYSDPLNDDFAGTDIKTRRIPPDFRYIHTSFLWRAISFFLYYAVALPLVRLMAKVFLGVKFKNRRVLRSLRKEGFFLYGNHTQALDVYLPALAAFPKRSYIISSPDAVSIRGIKTLVMMLGALPIPSAPRGSRNFREAIACRCRQRACVAVFPEAHIWPFYTGIRPFPDTSFRYPVASNAPAVAMVTTYRKRRGLFALCRRPGMTVTFSEVFRPDPSLSPRQAQAALREKVFGFMDKTARSAPQVVYIRYEQMSDRKAPAETAKR